MKRRPFLGSLLSLTTVPGLAGYAAPYSRSSLSDAARHPPYLKAGDLVGITSPAGYITLPEIQPAMERLQAWGFRVLIGDTIGKRDFTFGGTDEERAADFQQMLDNPQVKAILCARGGYGVVRMIDRLDWKIFRDHPKWIIGFSDITVLHAHVHRNLGIATIHSKMCNSFPDVWAEAEPIQVSTIESIRDALTGKEMSYEALPHPCNRNGQAAGPLLGGNLKILETLAGTSSDLNTRGGILFLEDVGEYLYNIDRMFWNLKRSGKLDHLRGLVIGGFNRLKIDDEGDEFGRTVQDIVWHHVRQFSYPVCFGFPVGHQKDNYALKCGLRHSLSVTDNGARLQSLH